MGRKRSVDLPEKSEPSPQLSNYSFEHRKWKAYNELRNGVSYRKAAANHNISYRCLFDYARGKKNRVESHEQYMALPVELERELADTVRRLTDEQGGSFPAQKKIMEMANSMIQRKSGSSSSQSNLPSSTPSPSPQKTSVSDTWVSNFLRRHPELSHERKSKKPKMGPSSPGPSSTPTPAQPNPGGVASPRPTSAYSPAFEAQKRPFKQWFNDLNKLIDKFHVLPHNIYNLSLLSFHIGRAGECELINEHNKYAFPTDAVTAFECICTNGTVLQPLFISSAAHTGSGNTNSNILQTQTGMADEQTSFTWLSRYFNPQTYHATGNPRSRGSSSWRVLITKAYPNAFNLLFLLWAWDHQILVMVLPPAIADIAAPSDMGLAGPLKQRLLEYVRTFFHRQPMAALTLPTYLDIYHQARDGPLEAHNIVSAWNQAGIVPRNPSKLIENHRILSQVVLTEGGPGGPDSETDTSGLLGDMMSGSSGAGTDPSSIYQLQLVDEFVDTSRLDSGPSRNTGATTSIQSLLDLVQTQIQESAMSPPQPSHYHEPHGAGTSNLPPPPPPQQSSHYPPSRLGRMNHMMELANYVFSSRLIPAAAKLQPMFLLQRASYELLVQGEIERAEEQENQQGHGQDGGEKVGERVLRDLQGFIRHGRHAGDKHVFWNKLFDQGSAMN